MKKHQRPILYRHKHERNDPFTLLGCIIAAEAAVLTAVLIFKLF